MLKRDTRYILQKHGGTINHHKIQHLCHISPQFQTLYLLPTALYPELNLMDHHSLFLLLLRPEWNGTDQQCHLPFFMMNF